jgi:hypothetical protein
MVSPRRSLLFETTTPSPNRNSLQSPGEIRLGTMTSKFRVGGRATIRQLTEVLNVVDVKALLAFECTCHEIWRKIVFLKGEWSLKSGVYSTR